MQVFRQRYDQTAAQFARGLGILVLLLGLNTPAHALFGDDEARKAILELRARVAEQEKQLRDKDAELASRTARLEGAVERLEAANRAQLEFVNTIDALRREIALLRGQTETLTNEVAVLQRRNRDLYGDIDARLKTLEPVSVSIDGQPATVDRSEQAAFDAALAQFRASDFRGAANALQAFISRYPESPYSAAAHYWLGNSLYAQKDYRAAINAQRAVVDKHPNSPRAPDAMLNIAASQIELKETRGARATLQKLISDFPKTEAAGLAADRLKALPK